MSRYAREKPQSNQLLTFTMFNFYRRLRLNANSVITCEKKENRFNIATIEGLVIILLSVIHYALSVKFQQTKHRRA